MEAASTSETLVNFYQTTWCSIPEESHLQFLIYFNTCKIGYLQSSSLVWLQFNLDISAITCHLGKKLGFEVLTAASMKMAVCWVVVPCSLVDVYRCFRGTCCLHHHHHTLMIEAASSTSEILINFNQTAWCYNPEDSHLDKKYWNY
jgi:hypothetical protein